MAFAALLGACATEVDPELASPEAGASAAPTTEFVATGSTAELLDELLSEAGSLSEAIVDNDGQHVIVARIDVIWEAARPGVEAATEGDVAAFERADRPAPPWRRPPPPRRRRQGVQQPAQPRRRPPRVVALSASQRR